MFTVPMDRWYVSRWFFNASREDFSQAVDGLRADMEELTGDKYDLKIAFYKAAKPAVPGEEMPRPEIKLAEVYSLSNLSKPLWNAADLVEAEFTSRKGESAVYKTGTVSAKWPERSALHFRVTPEDNARDICRKFLDGRFTLWSRGIDPR